MTVCTAYLSDLQVYMCVSVCKKDLQSHLMVMRIHFVDVKAACQREELASESASATQRALI